MSFDKYQDRRPAIQSQCGRKRQKFGGTRQRIRSPAAIGRRLLATEGPWRPGSPRVHTRRYPIRSWIIGRRSHRNRSRPRPSRCSRSIYKLNVFVTTTEEKAPVEWAGQHILGVRKARAYAILSEIGAHDDLEAWLRQKVLAGMASGRIGRGRETRPSALADAFFVALAGGELEVRNCGQCLAATTRADRRAAACHEHDEANSELRHYMVLSGLLWRLRPCGS